MRAAIEQFLLSESIEALIKMLLAPLKGQLEHIDFAVQLVELAAYFPVDFDVALYELEDALAGILPVLFDELLLLDVVVLGARHVVVLNQALAYQPVHLLFEVVLTVLDYSKAFG